MRKVSVMASVSLSIRFKCFSAHRPDHLSVNMSGPTDEHHAPETTGASYDQCGDGLNKRMMKDDATTDGDVQLSALSDEPFQTCSR